jgi:spore photoproduct lyase
MSLQCKFSTSCEINTDSIEVASPMPKVKLDTYEQLSGEKISMIKEVGDGTIIQRFDKTPIPKSENDVVCPHFLEFKWANGCNFNCAWCYLNGTLRFRPEKKRPYLKNKIKIIEHLEAFFSSSNNFIEILNSGELSDSLVYEGTNFSLTRDILPFFKQESKHKLLILTKNTNIKGIIKSESQDVVIVSFSVNAYPISDIWEHGAPTPKERINAAKKLSELGYTVRLRIDPMVPVEGWKEGYLELIDDIFTSFIPDRITIGSLRGLQSTINNSHDKSWIKYCGSCPGSILSSQKIGIPFDLIIGVEKESQKAIALEARLRSILPPEKIKVFNADIDAVSQTVANHLQNKTVSYIVIDPQALQGMTWSALKPLLSCKGDAMVTWFENEAWRVKTAAVSVTDHQATKAEIARMTELFGEGWQNTKTSDELTLQFINRVILECGKHSHAKVKIPRQTSGYYWMILFTGNFQNAQKLASEWEKQVRKRIDSATGKDLSMLLDVKTGRQRTLFSGF